MRFTVGLLNVKQRGSSISGQRTTEATRQYIDLQKRIRDLEEENEILKKAMYYFAKARH